uniref:Uncharacterized protein n=1 Tax=Taeniopygia guttata TaxID=59729 RepID=A0A674HNU8_TAEGU
MQYYPIILTSFGSKEMNSSKASNFSGPLQLLIIIELIKLLLKLMKSTHMLQTTEGLQ